MMRIIALSSVLCGVVSCCLVSCGGASAPGEADAAPEVPLCDPGPVGPHWVEEDEALSISIACLTGLPLDGDQFVLDDVPAGAVYDPAAGTLSWTPTLAQAGMYRIGLTAARDDTTDEVRVITIGVADRWDHPDNVPIADPLAYTHELGLPVLFLEPSPETEDYVPCTVYYGGRRFDIDAKLRGASSLAYPKRNYTLRFGQGARFDDPDHDFRDKNRVVLTSTFDDNSYIRQRLAFNLWSRLDPTIQVQAYSAVVYIDGAYHGLYTVTDFINDDLMEASGVSRDSNLYKAINHDANFRLTRNNGASKATLHDGYEKKEGTPVQGEPGAFDDLDELVSFVATSPDAEFGAGIADRIAVDEYVSWWLLVSFSTSSDSAGKNSYHSFDPADPDARWHVAPWDFNHSFGQRWTTHRISAASIETYEDRNRLFERLLADPDHGPAMTRRYGDALRTGPLAVDTVLAMIDGYIAEIDRSARRDWDKWRDAYQNFGRWNDRTDFTTYEQEVDYVRAWLMDHWAALTARF